ncbi:MAG: SPP1 phage holin family protein, partial [Clostridia bacterium]|nr:SPP1 phage holin family protein [Clostridia bacterium]
MKVSKGTIIRTIGFVVSIANLFLADAGKSPLPFSSAEVENVVSEGLVCIAGIICWWKNNSFTPAAIKADEF